MKRDTSGGRSQFFRGQVAGAINNYSSSRRRIQVEERSETEERDDCGDVWWSEFRVGRETERRRKEESVSHIFFKCSLSSGMERDSKVARNFICLT
ncbi:hypothetical protein TSUD_346470 [Trifolium subterraneum]|nr:hypothetical protein TSUD_346470 [Trifolium subterraneum]